VIRRAPNADVSDLRESVLGIARPLRWILRSQSLFLLVLSVTPIVGSCKGGAEIVWPISRNNLDKLILKLPKGYAGPTFDKLDTSEMRATDFPVEEDLVITAIWPDLKPPANYPYH
jgi:hypothetical protein